MIQPVPFPPRLRRGAILTLALLLPAFTSQIQAEPIWSGYAGNAQHTAASPVPTAPLQSIRWQTPVDLNPQFSGNDLLIHYGSPQVSAANTVIVPVKTGASDGFQLEAFNGATGALKWTQSTDYVLPPHNWTPSYSPTLTPTERIYYAGQGGTIYFRDNVDATVPASTGQLAFYDVANYNASPAAYNSSVFINTPITSDSAGNIYFGFQVTGSTPAGLESGIAKISSAGVGSWVSAHAAASDASIAKVVTNSAPAISSDGSTVYVAVSSGNFGHGDLLALNTSNLATTGVVALKDPKSGADALLPDDGTASPMVGANKDVYFGVLENPFNSSKGWMLHFNDKLDQTKTPGAFGWDDTPSLVNAALVPSYHGASTDLLMTKYNNYAGLGGDGVNKLAILDPNDTMIDPRTGATVMKEVISIAGPTPDAEFLATHPNAVREWCINTALVDPFTHSVLANSEDGKLYRWDLTTNTFTEQITLTSGIGEAYTPTFVGADGTVYAINNATLFAVAVPEPAGLSLFAAGAALLFTLRTCKRKAFMVAVKMQDAA